MALLVVALVVDAVEALAPGAAPPPGEVGLVGASVHAAVTAHARPSQAWTILVDIVQTARTRASDARIPGGESGIVALVPRSHRVPGLTLNRLSVARNTLQNQGISLIDLTGSNPTRAGLRYPDDLLEPLAGRAGLDYAPDPRGLLAARAAVGAELARHGASVDPGRVVLTASTSEAYAFLFKVLCDPGDEVLVPVPSYPLFEILSGLEAVRAVPYPLDPHGGWSYDAGAIAARVTARTRAVIVVSPNNPTGTVLSAADVRALSACCTTHGLALIADEVFVDYRLARRGRAPADRPHRHDVPHRFARRPVEGRRAAPAEAGMDGGGRSGSRGARSPGPHRAGRRLVPVRRDADPGRAAGDPRPRRGGARPDSRARRGQPRVAPASPRGVARRPTPRARRRLDGRAARPATGSEETLALDLLERHHVVVQPGYFYDFPSEAWLVVSLLVEPELFARGIERIVAATAMESDKMDQGPR